jgi:hypothetical protein
MDAVLDKHAQAQALHQQYLNSLHTPDLAEVKRISEIQRQKEVEIDRKYHTHSAQEHHAATKIQAAYRGHRERREQQGLVLDPSSRWSDLIAEMKYRSVIAPHHERPSISGDNNSSRTPSSSEIAKMHWRRAGWIAEHAGRGENASSHQRKASDMSSGNSSTASSIEQDEVSTMLMDLRYFLEMVDVKHRYGANLQVYHEFWRRQNTTQNFFYWLDHGPGLNLDLSLCSREKLDRERIRYLSREERKAYLVEIDDEGRLRWAKNGELITTSANDFEDSAQGIVPKGTVEPGATNAADRRVPDAPDDSNINHDLAKLSHLEIDSDSSSSSSAEQMPGASIPPKDSAPSHEPKRSRRVHVSPATLLNHLLRSSVKPGTWIYVTDTLNRLYIGMKNSGTFQHASFLSGARIRSAGSIGVHDGYLTYLSPLSGHYRPTTKSFKTFVKSLEDEGVDLSALKVSGAYKVLRSMEFYGKTKKGFRSMKHVGRSDEKKQAAAMGRKERAALELVHESQGVSATELVEQHWEKEHSRKKRSHKN